jgi:predicted transcriptional regulator YdeE
MNTIDFDHAIHVIGIELRTTNEEAFQTIPVHWKRFTEEGVPGHVAGKQSSDVYAVYTHFQNAGRNNQGLYSLVIGVSADAAAVVPQGFTRVVVPASLRAVFPVEKGRFDLVGAKALWKLVGPGRPGSRPCASLRGVPEQPARHAAGRPADGHLSTAGGPAVLTGKHANTGR